MWAAVWAAHAEWQRVSHARAVSTVMVAQRINAEYSRPAEPANPTAAA